LVEFDCLPELKTQIETSGPGIVLELSEVTLVDVEAVRFLGEWRALRDYQAN
jgi:hypothetical protein